MAIFTRSRRPSIRSMTGGTGTASLGRTLQHGEHSFHPDCLLAATAFLCAQLLASTRFL